MPPRGLRISCARPAAKVPIESQAVGAFEILFEFFAMLDVAQQQDRAVEIDRARSWSGETVTPTGVFLPQRVTKSPSPRALSWRGGWVFLTRSMSHGSRLKICSNG